MSISKVFARLSLTAAVLAWGAFAVFAADGTPAPVPVAVPVSVGVPGCETCQHGIQKSKCHTCGKLLGGNLHKDKKAPYQVNLCPGACFGYFQTQWRKWDEVCPYPYLGIGPGNNSNPPTVGTQPGRYLPIPQPMDPKMMDPKKSGSDSVPIPIAPAPNGR
jgi:hypothetical protein